MRIYSYFSDSEIADLQVLTEADEISWLCSAEWNIERAEVHSFAAGDLAQRSVTVFSFAGSGPQRVVEVHQLAGWQAGAAVILDTGESYLVQQTIPLYYAAESARVDRALIPSR